MWTQYLQEGFAAHAQLARGFGDRLAFHGGISIQRHLPFGTPEQLREPVRQRVAALAPGGGYILGTSHNLQADVPIENARALWEAFHTDGRYLAAGTAVAPAAPSGSAPTVPTRSCR